ncbi:haloacid dehalogenase [Sphingomonas sp. Root720]|nr:haloacid dehalogenase [Sphingomonas sp. Root710]KRB93724.1 haloacid dehalogenase [Sphingomonas sp. Root720]
MVIDMDGTLVLGDAASGGHMALPGAAALLVALKRRGIPFRVFTNGTAKPPAAYAASLRAAGLDVTDAELMTPASSAAAWFLARGIRRVRVLGREGVQQPLREAGLDVVQPGAKAEGVEAVFTGWYREFTFPDLEAACRDIWAGALATTASNVPFFAAQGGRAIGASFAINAMIRSLTGKRAKVLGKPSRAALRCALTLMGLPMAAEKALVVIGDDPALEMRMANAAGALSIGVTSGLNDAGTFTALTPADAAHVVLPGLPPLLELLSRCS